MSVYKDKTFGESKKTRVQVIAVVALLINRGISMAFGGSVDVPEEIGLPIAELAVDTVIGVGTWLYTVVQGSIDKKLVDKP